MYDANVPHDGDCLDFIGENDEPKRDKPRITEYGTSDLDVYQFNGNNGRFEVLDNGGGGVMESFSTFAQLVDYAISKVLAAEA